MAAGDLDPTFDDNGTKAISFGGTDIAHAVLVQPDGRIVVARGGSPGNAVARQVDGRLVVAGQRTGSDDFAVARLLG